MQASADKSAQRVAGLGVFLASRSDIVPGALLHNLKHNKVLHERVVILNVVVEDRPFVPADQRIEVEKLGKGFFGVNPKAFAIYGKSFLIQWKVFVKIIAKGRDCFTHGKK